MVKIEIKKDGLSLVHCEGTMEDILCELSEAICGIHAQIGKANPLMANVFKQVFIEAVSAPSSPIWDTRCSHGVGLSVCIPKDRK